MEVTDKMILDYLDNIKYYEKLHPKFKQAFSFLLNNDLINMPVGKHEIDGDNLFVILDKSHGREKEDAMLEIHRKYIDIQLILDGTDEMGWESKLKCVTPYDEYNTKSDIQFFKDRPSSWFTVKKEMFAVFFPDDAHLPLIGNSMIHKAVAKVYLAKS
jgi:biofilm protein TabA